MYVVTKKKNVNKIIDNVIYDVPCKLQTITHYIINNNTTIEWMNARKRREIEITL